jgi:NACalpha-BTF3-like transcription factor
MFQKGMAKKWFRSISKEIMMLPVKTLRAFERALIKSKETKNIQLTSPKIHLPSMMKKQMIWFRNPAIIPFFMAELLMMRG